MTHEPDDGHDRGLAFDLQTLLARRAEPRRLERRGALKLLVGAGAGLVLVACGGDDASPGTTTSGDASTTTIGGATTSTEGGAATEAIPEETGGPFPGDGSNGPNVLAESGVVRSDIRPSLGDLSGMAEGVMNTLELTIVTASTGAPLAGAAMYLWHCDREGGYSLYSPGVTDQNYLRGVQETDAEGHLTFTSVFPGAYSGRWPHAHFEIFPSLDSVTTSSAALVTSQLAFPEDVCDEVYTSAGYEQSVRNMAQTALSSDMVFSDGVDQQMAEVTGALSTGLVTTLTIAV